MNAVEIMKLIRQEPEEVILELGEMLDDLRAGLVDAKLEAAVNAGAFDEMAQQALKDYSAGKTVPLNEFLSHS